MHSSVDATQVRKETVNLKRGQLQLVKRKWKEKNGRRMEKKKYLK